MGARLKAQRRARTTDETSSEPCLARATALTTLGMSTATRTVNALEVARLVLWMALSTVHESVNGLGCGLETWSQRREHAKAIARVETKSASWKASSKAHATDETWTAPLTERGLGCGSALWRGLGKALVTVERWMEFWRAISMAREKGVTFVAHGLAWMTGSDLELETGSVTAS